MVHTGFTDLMTGKFHHRKWSFQETAGNKLSEKDLQIDVPGLKATMPARDRFLLEFAVPTEGEQTPVTMKLDMTSQKPIVLHGDQGYSRKGPCPTCASHYSSFTRLAGNFSIDHGPISSAIADQPAISRRQTGKAQIWYDHEFGSQTLDNDQTGWDWFSIQLDNPQEEWMLFQVRSGSAKSGKKTDVKNEAFQSATQIMASGESKSVNGVLMTPEGRWKSSRSGGTYPATWTVQIPGKAGILRVIPRLADQEVLSQNPAIPTYWEGACDVLDATSGKKIGRAYLEMTGYAPGSRPGI
jgi:predicted secreted hydrolase